MSETWQMTTGQIFVRHQGACPDRSDRRLIMVVGLLAIPDPQLLTEHQYTLMGSADAMHLHIEPGTGIDRSSVAYGQGAGGILRQPIWRF